MSKTIFIAAIILLFATNCFAVPAGNTSDTKVPYGPGIANLKASGFGPLKASFDVDWVFKKDLKEGQSGISDADIEGQWYLFRLGYTFKDRVEPYIRLGVSHLKTSWTQHNTQAKVRGEDGFAIGIGGKALAFEIPEHKIRLSLDGQYIYTDPDIAEARIDGLQRSITASEFRISEWQITGILSMEFTFKPDDKNPAAPYSVIPYIGAAYFDSDTKAKFDYGTTSYSLGNAENKHKFLFITGCDIASPENLSINVEGRWVGETAASGGITFKF